MKVTRATMKTWATSLEEAIASKEEATQNAVNEYAQKRLEEEIGALQDILDAVENYIELY